MTQIYSFVKENICIPDLQYQINADPEEVYTVDDTQVASPEILWTSDKVSEQIAASVPKSMIDMYYCNKVDTYTNSSTDCYTFWGYNTLSSPFLPLGTYRLNYDYKWKISSTSKRLYTRILCNNVTELATKQQYISNTGEYLHESGFVILANISGVQTFTLQFKPEYYSTGYIQYGSMDFWRVL